MDADKFQYLPILGIFIAGMMNESLNNHAVIMVSAICTGNMPFGQTASFCFAFCPT